VAHEALAGNLEGGDVLGGGKGFDAGDVSQLGGGLGQAAEAVGPGLFESLILLDVKRSSSHRQSCAGRKMRHDRLIACLDWAGPAESIIGFRMNGKHGDLATHDRDSDGAVAWAGAGCRDGDFRQPRT
jgi:hypothetical protein